MQKPWTSTLSKDNEFTWHGVRSAEGKDGTGRVEVGQESGLAGP